MEKEKCIVSLNRISRFRTELYGISILWIMIFHYDKSFPRWLGVVLQRGNMGCELFLFASGISLYYAWQKNPTFFEFFKNRIFRVMIPVFVIRSWNWILKMIRGEIGIMKLISRLLCLDFWVTGDGEIWFVSFLLVAYFLYPFVYSFLYEMKSGTLWMRTAVLIGMSVLITLIIMRNNEAYYSWTEIALTRFPIFILGSAFGKAVYEKKTIEKNAPFIYGVMVTAVVFFFGLINSGLFDGISYRYLYFVPGFLLVILIANGMEFVKEPVRKVFRYFGSASLELYLIHLLLGRHLLPRTGFFDRSSLVHYISMLVLSSLIAWPVKQLDSWLYRKFRNLVS